MLFARLLERIIQYGRLTVIDAHGRSHTFGGAAINNLPPVVIRLHDKALHYQLFLNPRLILGEAYMDGSLTVEEGGLYNFLALCAINLTLFGGQRPVGKIDRLAYRFRRLRQINTITRAHRNVAHHYDLPTVLYELFLDSDLQYSCAYFTEAGLTLEAAQEAKKQHVIGKLLLRPGHRVLDIGAGWGGLALSIARSYAVAVTGITLSESQLRVARRRAAQAELMQDGSQLQRGSTVQFDLRDYREQEGRFDRIVSVAMFEQVGTYHYRVFFDKLRSLLEEDGVAVLHSVGRSEGPGTMNPWMNKYVFPGAYGPALSEVLPAVEGSGLFVTDIEILRLHYADTLREWRRRFLANRGEIAKRFDERFCRMWEFYLAGCETAFRHQDHMVFQMQLAKKPDSVPITRDYVVELERAARANKVT